VSPGDGIAHPEPIRARYPDREGYVERDGVRVFWELYGEENEAKGTILFLPTGWVSHSRAWKAQIPYFARHFRVLTFDARGNGKSDRPTGAAAYDPLETVADTLAVMEATETERALTVSLSMGTFWHLGLAGMHPDRVEGCVFEGPVFPVCEPFPAWADIPFNQVLERYEGWDKYNAHYVREEYRGFLEFWMRQVFPEPHSTLQIEYSVDYGLETDGEIVATILFDALAGEAKTAREGFETGVADQLRQLAEGIRSPVLVVSGDLDVITPPKWAEALAEVTGGRLEMIEGSGHVPHGRKPVAFNLALREFAESVFGPVPVGAETPAEPVA
jgi:pimeloyl-ACP methyl ester carboxylesterase